MAKIDFIMKKAEEAGKVVIVGAGARGRRLLRCLKGNALISVLYFFDNKESVIGKCIQDIKIVKPYKVEEYECLYIIATADQYSQIKLYSKLNNLRIDNIIIYHEYKDYDYLSNLDEKYYTEAVQGMYYERFGKKMNWKAPVTYNEKINWEKVNVNDKRRTLLADKYLVREWIKGQIGEKHLTKLYGVWEDVEDIDFDALPDAFVLKVNNGSERNIIVKDKGKINKSEICRKLNEWKNHNFAFASLELHYENIVPKIICEEYLEGLADNIYDYNIYCFHGEPKYIWCIKGSHKPDCKASFYNQQWEMQPFSYGYPKDPVLAPKPEKLDEMLELSRRLCKEFEHVRVDWYNMPDGRVLFGEMTFSIWGGLCFFEPEEFDTIFGNLI